MYGLGFCLLLYLLDYTQTKITISQINPLKALPRTLDSENELLHWVTTRQISIDEWLSELLPGVSGSLTELLLNPQDLIVLCESFAATRRSGFELPGRNADRKVRDECIFGFAVTCNDRTAFSNSIFTIF